MSGEAIHAGTSSGEGAGPAGSSSRLTARFDSLDPLRGPSSYLFRGHRTDLAAYALDEVVPTLERVTAAVAGGGHAAGFVAYEAAPAFDRSLSVHPPMSGLPLVHFGIYDERVTIPPLTGLDSATGQYALSPDPLTMGPDRFRSRVLEILELIAAGDTYQVNLTFRMNGGFEGSPEALYRDLVLAQRSAFCAFLPLGRDFLLSASPELFFRTRGGTIEMRPMKGTRPRGRWAEEDEALARDLAASPKDRAENLMIVDLLRNDLGRIAEYGSVRVPDLFEVERYPTVHQLVSSIEGWLRPGTTAVDIFSALFPSGSVTGAPKVRTSEIIRDLEDAPRGAYTGAIGFLGPDETVFNVAIRTLLVDTASRRYELGVGCGVTADSDPGAEYEECLTKAAFLTHRPPEFDLLESLGLDVPGGYVLLEEHVDRMENSARYFGYVFDRESVVKALEAAVVPLAGGRYKVRLLVDREGRPRTEVEPISGSTSEVRLRLATEPVDTSNRFLFHKTTNRGFYPRARASTPAADDVILFNRAGHLTETATANLVLKLDGELVTPPIESGLLPGVLRGRLIAENRISTRVLVIEDLTRASNLYLINSVRGWRRGILLGE